MSNDYTNKRTWEIDTAEDINGTFLVDGFEYYPAAKGNDLDIEDAGGDKIWIVRGIAGAPNNESYGIERKMFISSPRKCRGIYVKTIDAGTLYVYLNDASNLA